MLLGDEKLDGKPINDPFYQEFRGRGGQETITRPPMKGVSGQDKLSKLIGEVSSNLRILEDRYSNLRKKTQLTDQALLETQRQFFKEKRIIAEEIVEIKMKLSELAEELGVMSAELKSAVKQNDFKVIEKYLDMWEPMQFLTRKEAEEIIEDSMGEE